MNTGGKSSSLSASVAVLQERVGNVVLSVDMLRAELHEHCRQHRQLWFFLVPTALQVAMFTYLILIHL
jgi:hypothetical protein